MYANPDVILIDVLSVTTETSQTQERDGHLVGPAVFKTVVGE